MNSYLRQQAEVLRAMSRETVDLGMAERLRKLAAPGRIPRPTAFLGRIRAAFWAVLGPESRFRPTTWAATGLPGAMGGPRARSGARPLCPSARITRQRPSLGLGRPFPGRVKPGGGLLGFEPAPGPFEPRDFPDNPTRRGPGGGSVAGSRLFGRVYVP
jgi:hypothetical protein